MIVHCHHCEKAISSKQERCPYCCSVNEHHPRHAPTVEKAPAFAGFLRPLFTRR